MQTIGYAAQIAGSALAPWNFERRALRDNDVAIEIGYCGVCHSDIHQTRDDWKEWGPTIYPSVPGHEIIGRVIEVGSGVMPLHFSNARPFAQATHTKGANQGFSAFPAACQEGGGEGGIRTHGERKPTTVFETVPIDHSGTSPQRHWRAWAGTPLSMEAGH